MPDLARELLLVAGMAVAMVVLHLLGLMSLVQTTRLHLEHLRTPWLLLDRLLVPLALVMSLFILHGLEVFAFASLYFGQRAVGGWEQSLFLSAGAYSTVGWATLVVPVGWRLVAAFEGLTGALLVGWSTAFLFQNLHRILQSRESHPLPEGAIASDADDATAGTDSPRPKGSGKGSP